MKNSEVLSKGALSFKIEVISKHEIPKEAL